MKDYNQSKSNLVNLATGVLVGAVIGGALAMLFAPDSGKNNRKFLSKQAKKLTSKMNDSAHKASDSLKETYKKITSKI